MTIQEYFGEWSKVLDLNEANRIIRKLSASHAVICPKVKNIFKAFTLCPFNELRVVIIGQDPYPNTINNNPVATGIAFANSSDTPEVSYSSSLEVLRESVIDFTIPHRRINFEPDLEKWETQGVLLINAALSCEEEKIGSHMLLWRPFMKSFLSSLSNYHSGIVYVLMGAQAQSLESYINKTNNYVIRIRHPSWYARQKERMPSDVWKDINKILTGQNGYGIKWYNEYN